MQSQRTVSTAQTYRLHGHTNLKDPTRSASAVPLTAHSQTINNCNRHTEILSNRATTGCDFPTATSLHPTACTVQYSTAHSLGDQPAHQHTTVPTGDK